MKVYIPSDIGIQLVDADWPLPAGQTGALASNVPQGFDSSKPYYYKFVDGAIEEKTEQEKASIDVFLAVPVKYRKQVDGYWVEMTAEEKLAVDAAEETAWQEAKSPALKALENIYVDFLTNMWTPALRTAAIIAPDYTITVANTDEATNMYFLMQLRVIDYTVYDQMANEFLRLKTAIVGNGGIMSKVIPHV